MYNFFLGVHMNVHCEVPGCCTVQHKVQDLLMLALDLMRSSSPCIFAHGLKLFRVVRCCHNEHKQLSEKFNFAEK